MRPIELDIEGFASFRQRTVIDFSDTNLFVLTGPTGSGKSSVVDAIGFGLYGSVPRLGNDRLVSPVVSRGASRMKVSFTFSANDQTYRSTRLVKVTGKDRATTPEARLERLDGNGQVIETLAGDAGEVTAKVTGLLGLTFEEFCRVVVLPQGAFQQFLLATPKERRDLLFRLLNLGMLDEIGTLARQRENEGKQQSDALEGRLADLSHATDEAVADAKGTIGGLDSLYAEVKAEDDDLQKVRERGGELRVVAKAAEERQQAISKLGSPPAKVTSLSERVRSADDAVTAATDTLTAAKDAETDAQKAVDSLTDKGLLDRALNLAARAADTATKADVAHTALDEAQRDLELAQERYDTANADVSDAQARVREAERENSAYVLAQDLQEGHACPVCCQEVTDLPQHDEPEEVATTTDLLDNARTELTEATTQRSDAQQALSAAQATVNAADEARDNAAAEVAELVKQLPADLTDGNTVNVEKVDTAVSKVDEAAGQLNQAAADRKQAEAAAKDATDARQNLDAEAEDAWTKLSGVRDTVASLSPPPLDRSVTVAEAWTTLAQWAAEQRTTVTQQKDEADAAIAACIEEFQERSKKLTAKVQEHGVSVVGDVSARDAVVTTLSNARARLDQLEQDIQRADALRDELVEVNDNLAVASSLAKLLDTRQFATWVGNQVLETLSAAASSILHDITHGSYSLQVNAKGTFEIVDHVNGDTVGHVRTLSGGETFLASLSLALALAEHITSQAAGSTARLETLILDEGFGTLDPSMRDMVATAIEELGATGRTVGIITHFGDLAERIPTQFQIARGPDGSTVEKVAV